MNTSKGTKWLLYTLMFAWIFVLSSCTVGYHRPRHHRTGVVIQSYDNNRQHDNGLHKGQYKRYKKNKH